MNNILLNSDQIIDLIFEKHTLFDDICIATRDSGMEILHKIEERLIHGKVLNRKVELLRESDGRKDHRVR